jgi:hypothetical protein
MECYPVPQDLLQCLVVHGRDIMEQQLTCLLVEHLKVLYLDSLKAILGRVVVVPLFITSIAYCSETPLAAESLSK